jgi:peptidyl-prolyl cis-trans isomerase B (cyclophilin B)
MKIRSGHLSFKESRYIIGKLLLSGLLLWWLVGAGRVIAQQPIEDESIPPNPQVRLKTSKGEMVVELFPRHAPQSVDLFLQYAREGCYNQVPFERYVEGFAIQSAAVEGAEFPPLADERRNGLNHVSGSVGLAWDYVRRQSGSKLYICLSPVPQLDNRHTLIGQVTEGLEVLSQLRPGDRLVAVVINESPVVTETEVNKTP